MSILSAPDKTEGCELSIVFADSETIRELNLQYRGKNAPTDVLSFAMSGGGWPETAVTLLGDVMICPEIVRLNALELGLSFEEELVFVLVHGILHLFGYDHMDTASEEAMKKMSDSIISSLKLRNTADVKGPV